MGVVAGCRGGTTDLCPERHGKNPRTATVHTDQNVQFANLFL